MSKIIEIKGLTKRFGNLTALNNLNLEVEEGAVIGFLGPNGAGKNDDHAHPDNAPGANLG